MSDGSDREMYQNPVFPHSFPDPFVLKHRGAYWAYCTGRWHDDRCFGVLHSDDLVRWEERPGAMAPLPGEWPDYWAPEVFYDNGTFYLYYSAGNEEHMEIRVATSPLPGGPFLDSGRRLTREPFAIDAHVFQDADGKRYLFYATDFLGRSHVGTGTVADQLLDPFTLRGAPHPVTLPRYDWHLYDPHRPEKGGVRWYTNEGPFVLHRKGRYYQMFSGGNWRYAGYGVSYAVSDSLDTPEEWTHAADGTRVLPILRSVPDKVVGPGHNSVVRGPDNRQLFCVYHEWVDDERVMAIDRLEWAGERMLVLGPTVTPQPGPVMPSLTGFAVGGDGAPSSLGWSWAPDEWEVRDGTLRRVQADGQVDARLSLPVPQFLVELTVRITGEGPAGLGLSDVTGRVLLHLEFTPAGRCAQASLAHLSGDKLETEPVSLPPDLDVGADHLLRLEGDGRQISLSLDGHPVVPYLSLVTPPMQLVLTAGNGAEFAGFSLTLGWEDQFTEAVDNLEELGWTAGAGAWHIAGQQLWQSNPAESDAWIEKGVLPDSCEVVVNVRRGTRSSPSGWYGFSVSTGNGRPLLAVESQAAGWVLSVHGTAGEQAWPLPAAFDPFVYQQFRFRREGSRMMVWWEDQMLGEIAVPVGAGRLRLHAHHAEAAFDMVRITALCRAGYPPPADRQAPLRSGRKRLPAGAPAPHMQLIGEGRASLDVIC